MIDAKIARLRLQSGADVKLDRSPNDSRASKRVFLEVPDPIVPVRVAGERALSLACDELGLNGALERRIHWYALPDDDDDDEFLAGSRQTRFWLQSDVLGYVKPFGAHHELWIRTRQDPPQVAATVAHEAFHSAQLRWDGPQAQSSDEAYEHAARAYAAGFMTRWGGSITAVAAASASISARKRSN